MANSVKLKLNVASVNRLGENLRRQMELALDAGGLALTDIAEEIKDRSYEQCPKGTGTLAESSFVETINGTEGEEVGARVGYGGSADKYNQVEKKMASEYMVPVHERMDLKHPNGKAKFLEDPCNEVAGDIEAKLAQGIKPSFQPMK